jgi:hypothetical protein
MAEKTIKSKFYKTSYQPLIGETWVKLMYDPTNGDTRLLEYNTGLGGAVGNSFEVYKNGVWNYTPGVITTAAEKQKIHNLVKELINQHIKGVPGNVVPAFAIQNSESRDVGTSGTSTPSQSSGGLSSIIGDILGPINIAGEFESANMGRLFPESKTLKYPYDIIENQQDILKITQYEYKAPYGNIFQGNQTSADLFSKGAQRQSALKKALSTVILPIPNNIADSNSVNWGDGDQTNSMSMAAVGNVRDIAGIVAGTNLAASAAKSLGYENLSNILSSEQAANAIALLNMKALKNPTTNAAIQSLILKKAGFDISPETILSRGYGVVANSNLELLFSGPMLRGFQFGYVLSPRSREEAETCRKIIRYFKQGMAAKKNNISGGGPGASSFLLATPNVFKLQYKTFDKDGKIKDIAGLNKFKICALTNFQVSYADGQWSAFKEGQPVRYQINLSFKELEPIYESDYQGTLSGSLTPNITNPETNKKEYLDQPTVLDGEIGF